VPPLFRIARNPDEDSTLPFLLWVPVGYPNVPILFAETRQLARSPT
jgi:hypothetical protein